MIVADNDVIAQRSQQRSSANDDGVGYFDLGVDGLASTPRPIASSPGLENKKGYKFFCPSRSFFVRVDYGITAVADPEGTLSSPSEFTAVTT